MGKKVKQKMVAFPTADDLLGGYDIPNLKRLGMYDRTMKRKARYWCYKIKLDNPKLIPPEGFKEFVESLAGFGGWDKFSVTWDLHGSNPFMIVYRILSVHQEWDQVMERVAIPVNATESESRKRQRFLEKQYHGK